LSVKQNHCRVEGGQKWLRDFCEIQLDPGKENAFVVQLGEEYSSVENVD